MKYAKVKYVDFSKYNRVIAISDIHGDDEGFLNVLQQVEFSKNDALVIVGDILEKGDYFLRLLRIVMDYAEQGNVYVIAGNNDIVLLEWYAEEASDENILRYMSARNTVLRDMADELGLSYGTIEEVRILKEEIRKKYHREIEFLDNLPHIIESDIATFVHAGIQPGSLEEQDYEYCLTAKAFASEPYFFEKPVVVGHWPASNYCDTIIDVKARCDYAKNIFSIDGGNSMKSWQQINYLIFEDGEMKSGFYEHLPQVRVLEEQAALDNPVSLIFSNTQIEVKEQLEHTCICYVPYFDKEMEFANDRIYQYKGGTYCYDFTTYRLPVKAGEVVSFCEETNDGILVKRDGIVGEYVGRYEFVEE